MCDDSDRWCVSLPDRSVRAEWDSSLPTRRQSFDETAAEWGCSPYTVARITQQIRGTSLAASVVKMLDVASMPTGRIIEKLAEMGICISREQFVSAARGHRSAWELSWLWRTGIPADKPYDHDFTALAVCELWKRWCPDPPSEEMVDDLIQQGYVLMSRREDARALDCWWSAWVALRDWIPPEPRSIDGAEGCFRGSLLLAHWLVAFATYWYIDHRDSRLRSDRDLALLQECIERFPEADSERLRHWGEDLALVHLARGEIDQGRAVLERLMSAQPQACGPYGILAGHLSSNATTPQQLEEALDVLLRAKAAGVLDGHFHDLDMRIESVCESLGLMLLRQTLGRDKTVD